MGKGDDGRAYNDIVAGERDEEGIGNGKGDDSGAYTFYPCERRELKL